MKKMWKWKTLIAVVLLLSIISFIYVGDKYNDIRGRKKFEEFYSSFLSGKIVKIDKYSRGAIFLINNDSIEYRFYPYTNKNLNNGEIFQHLAAPGDSIYKKRFSDTLLLIKNNKVYQYTFQKYHDVSN